MIVGRIVRPAEAVPARRSARFFQRCAVRATPFFHGRPPFLRVRDSGKNSPEDNQEKACAIVSPGRGRMAVKQIKKRTLDGIC